MMEAERVALCGPNGQPDPDQQALRGGHTRNWLTLGGRRVPMGQPRARSMAGEELSLASLGWAEKRDPLNDATLAAIAAGVSTHRYEGTLDALPASELEGSGSRSSVSRRFVALSAEQLGERLSCWLELDNLVESALATVVSGGARMSEPGPSILPRPPRELHGP